MIKNAFLLCLLSLISITAAAADMPSPVGKWKTIDDESGEVKSVVEITEANGVLTGKIVQLFLKPNEKSYCEKCSGDNFNKPLMGMTILWDMKKDDDIWRGGKIMDPGNGSTYGCKIKVLDDGKKLKVRGFLGISLLGRSQVWERF